MNQQNFIPKVILSESRMHYETAQEQSACSSNSDFPSLFNENELEKQKDKTRESNIIVSNAFNNYPFPMLYAVI